MKSITFFPRFSQRRFRVRTGWTDSARRKSSRFASIRFSLRVGHQMTLDPRKAYLNNESTRTYSRSRHRNRLVFGSTRSLHKPLLPLFQLFAAVVALLTVACRIRETISHYLESLILCVANRSRSKSISKRRFPSRQLVRWSCGFINSLFVLSILDNGGDGGER